MFCISSTWRYGAENTELTRVLKSISQQFCKAVVREGNNNSSANLTNNNKKILTTKKKTGLKTATNLLTATNKYPNLVA